MRIARNVGVSIVFLSAILGLGGCDPEASGFSLPRGNADAGKEAFVHLGCQQCHSIVDELDKQTPGHPEIHFKLGGETTRIRTYGDLVTSIINPNHKIAGYAKDPASIDSKGDSNMPSHNEVMTVQELVDLTTYLQTTYEIIPPEAHRMYYP